ncbi:hypothetical protein Vadar_028039 [Vaccinium darrowii]|uniref:Uncharacterized protein n=1 Tax=Vaccinium darrowii TaxID=229202 RepID=A0ACB7YAM3_9ERIC|nr:hypothetical protein Vadar_028039 [Vaccinium darrowii]
MKNFLYSILEERLRAYRCLVMYLLSVTSTGVGDKSPWQIFSDEDPWEICKNRMKIEGTIYVFTNLIKASKSRVARIAGCGVWHAETALEQVVDDYSRDKKSRFKVHQEISRKRKNVGDDLIVPKPGKRIRTEFVQEHKTDCDIVVAPATEGVPFSEELLEVEKQGENSRMHSDMVDGDFEELDSLISLLESEEQPSLGFDCDAYGTNSLTAEVVMSGPCFSLFSTGGTKHFSRLWWLAILKNKFLYWNRRSNQVSILIMMLLSIIC